MTARGPFRLTVDARGERFDVALRFDQGDGVALALREPHGSRGGNTTLCGRAAYQAPLRYVSALPAGSRGACATASVARGGLMRDPTRTMGAAP